MGGACEDMMSEIMFNDFKTIGQFPVERMCL